MSIKRQFYIFTIILALYSSKINAQVSVGIDAGLTYNKLNYKTNNVLLGKKSGYVTNINVDYSLNKWLSIEGSAGIFQKNYSISNKNNIRQQINNNYLQFPVSMKYSIKVIKGLCTSISLGAYYAYWIYGSVEGVAPNIFELSTNSDGEDLIKLQNIKYSYKFDTTKDNRSEFGWVAKVGLNHKIVNALDGSIKIYYYQSVTDQQKKIQELQNGRYNQSCSVTMGIIYHFKY